MSDEPETDKTARLRMEVVRLQRILSRMVEERECGHPGLCLENPFRPDLPASKNPCRQCRILDARLTPDQVPIEDLPFNTRAYKALRWLGCRVRSDVEQIPFKELTRLKNIGPKTTSHILAVISASQPGLPCFDRQPERFSIALPAEPNRWPGGKGHRVSAYGWLALLKDIFGRGYRWRMASPIDQGAFSVALGFALHRLPDRMRELIIKRYGLEDGKAFTLATLSKTLGVTRERIRQLQQKALAALRKPGNSVILRGFLPPQISSKSKGAADTPRGVFGSEPQSAGEAVRPGPRVTAIRQSRRRGEPA